MRVSMEAGIVAGLGVWGAHIGGGTASKLALAVLIPAVGFGVWGGVDFRGSGRLAEPLRLIQELTVTTGAVMAWYTDRERLLKEGA